MDPIGEAMAPGTIQGCDCRMSPDAVLKRAGWKSVHFKLLAMLEVRPSYVYNWRTWDLTQRVSIHFPDLLIVFILILSREILRLQRLDLFTLHADATCFFLVQSGGIIIQSLETLDMYHCRTLLVFVLASELSWQLQYMGTTGRRLDILTCHTGCHWPVQLLYNLHILCLVPVPKELTKSVCTIQNQQIVGMSRSINTYCRW